MKATTYQLETIPAAEYGSKTDKVYLFVHGKNGCKEEAEELAELVCPLGWQVLAIDLPEHGERRGETDSFDPWHVVPELRAMLTYARRHWRRIALRATSIGAWFSMLAFDGEALEQSLFVSPVLDMERLIQTMMGWAEVTPAQLEAEKKIKTSFGETLSWQYYQYAREHAVKQWDSPTSILYAERDNLTPRQVVDSFAARFHCDLTVAEGGGHWFHTPEQLNVLRQWTRSKVVTDLTAEECLFFTGYPEKLSLYEMLRSRILQRIGSVKIKVQKTQITFAGKYGFTFVSLPRRKQGKGIVVSFGLFHRQDAPRIEYASEPYPNRWTHHTTVQSPEEIDGELMGWIEEAYWFSEQK